ncbi:RNA dependent RNA polymerase-domain-containing protein [Aspergillus alliaceus]|uniref:RNA dependent RNA polymerase-domain-containing protein n=1 Tax=Petromyces alliaceus TaxID=209559 RepID=A0A5N7BTA1_PETAA|nr:RNA dependent RNA polymerase-domain-containing protein [Aspergillus alliaceus]
MPSKRFGSFTYTLQSEFTLSDTTWYYNVPGLPKAPKTNAARLIKSLELVSNPSTRKLVLKFVKVDPNRATSSVPLDRLVHFSCADFRVGQYDEGQWKRGTARESADYLARLLKHGITINNVLYSFYGHSSSQLKSRSCYLLCGSREKTSNYIESLGDFSNIKTVAKKAKRIGLLFSSCQAVISVAEERYEDIEDITRLKYNFTDGCGLVGPDTAKLLARKLSIVAKNSRYNPSVYQIRFKGYKGIVTVEPRMRKGCWFQFRQSMRKFSGTMDPSFAVVAYSKPYTYGYLNDDIVLLLHALGISTDVLLKKQDEHFRLLQEALTEPSTAFMVLCALDKFDLAERLVLHGIENITDPLRSLVTCEYTKMLNKRQSQRCRILVQDSRLVFGACDPRDVLEEGECFLRVTDETYGGQARTIMGCEVLVTRNPCLHPGDVRKLRAVDRPELCHLKDCIIFSVKGDRPAADQMSGGDLDGDTFFVCWDPALIPSTMSQPAEYPAGPEPLLFHKITVEDRIDYFARYTSASLGRVKNLFLEWAIQKGAFSSECQELNRLHSLCVDGNRVNVPPRLERPPPVKDEILENFVLNILHREGENKAQLSIATNGSLTQFNTREVVEEILSQPRSCSEFYMLQLVHDWCRRQGTSELQEFLHYINLDALTVERRHWLLQALPPAFDYPSLIMNDLLGSNILRPKELSPYHLDYTGLRWKCIFSDQSRLSNLMEVLEQSFHQFHRKLLVLRINERFSVAIYVSNRIAVGEDILVGRAVRVIAFPHTHGDLSGHRRIVTTSVESRLYYDQNYLQLYDKQRGNTFIWIGRPANDTSAYRSKKGAANRARERQNTINAGINHDWAISIALQKFGQSTQNQIGRIRREGVQAAELYVISNTDLKSFHTLDLWLDSVDTDETIPLFEKVAPPLTIPQLSTVDWTLQPPVITALLRDQNISLLEGEQLQLDILSVLQFCFGHGETSFPAEVYRYYLESASSITAWLTPDALLDGLVKGLAYTPSNVVFFSRISPWEQAFSPNLVQVLREQAPRLVRALVQAANDIGSFAMDALQNILYETKSMSISAFGELVEHICLTVNSPEQILDLFFETLEPLCHALLKETLPVREYLTRNVFGVALDHSEEARESLGEQEDLWVFEPFQQDPTLPVLKSHRRLDAPKLKRLVAGDHVQFRLARYPENVFLTSPATFDAMVESSQPGEIVFRPLSYPPAFAAEGRWYMKHCGSFVTSKAMLDSLVKLLEDKVDACALYPLLVEGRALADTAHKFADYVARSDLNESQNRAVLASLTSPLTCIWGPPGTGKTHTVAVILQELLQRNSEDRILVTAPTHNAVDNILRRYLKHTDRIGIKPLRVSTNVRKVAQDLVQYTCDAMEGKEMNFRPEIKRRALERIQQSRLVFTTCAGAGLGLLRDEKFQIVIIDEASQQTEPMSLIPLSKGCTHAILVGDHVQLRVSTRKCAKVTDSEVSLFERLYTNCDIVNGGFSKVMLDVQYRMHPQICNFPSQEFYEGRLTTDSTCCSNSLPTNKFPWPEVETSTGKVFSRRVFAPCLAEEDIGYRSKGNINQARLCKEIYHLLTSSRSQDNGQGACDTPSEPVAILTPYTRQVEILKDHLPSSTIISTIDAFQGQEAEIIIYVTVRCNPHGDLGFLNDLRRLNVVLTRAKAGLIVIGCPRTLSTGTGTGAYISHDSFNGHAKKADSNKPLAVDGDSGPVWGRLLSSLTRVDIPTPWWNDKDKVRINSSEINQ